jgi:hypothetical protein
MPTQFDHAGGGEADLYRLEDAFYNSVLADPLPQPLFGAGRPDHVEHLTAFTKVHNCAIGKRSRELRRAWPAALTRPFACTPLGLEPSTCGLRGRGLLSDRSDTSTSHYDQPPKSIGPRHRPSSRSRRKHGSRFGRPPEGTGGATRRLRQCRSRGSTNRARGDGSPTLAPGALSDDWRWPETIEFDSAWVVAQFVSPVDPAWARRLLLVRGRVTRRWPGSS